MLELFEQRGERKSEVGQQRGREDMLVFAGQFGHTDVPSLGEAENFHKVQFGINDPKGKEKGTGYFSDAFRGRPVVAARGFQPKCGAIAVAGW